MIRKSLATALALLLAYQSWLSWAQPAGNHTLTFTEGNIIIAQRYLHGRHDQPIVFVGSSLTRAMQPYLQNQDVACLGMVGLGVADGMELVARSGAHPRLVMLEINHFQRAPSPEFLDAVLRPQLFWLRNNFSATRHEFQPANLFVPWLDAALRGQKLDQPQSIPARPLPAGRIHSPDPQTGRDEAGLKDDLEGALYLLPSVYQQAQELHVDIGLYEVPEHPDVNRSPQMQKFREAVQECFQQPVLFDQEQRYYTVDGQHLDGEDASAYAYFLLQQARQRLQAGHSPPP